MRFIRTFIKFTKSSIPMFCLDIVSLNNRLGYESKGYLWIFYMNIQGYTDIGEDFRSSCGTPWDA